MRKNHGFGVVVSEHAAGEFSENNILENRRCAVMCGGDSAPCLDMNDISGGQQGGVWVQDRSKCVLRQNRLFNNRKAALQVSACSDPMVIGNKFFDGKGGGLVVHEKAMGTFLRNTMSDNQHAGMRRLCSVCVSCPGSLVCVHELLWCPFQHQGDQRGLHRGRDNG